MTVKTYGLFTLAACFLIGLGTGSALAGSPMGGASTEAQILNPGQSAECSHDFVVENKSDRATEVQLVMGDQDLWKDEIQPNGSKGYSLRGTISRAQQQGKKVNGDDPATIINLSKESKIKFYCKE